MSARGKGRSNIDIGRAMALIDLEKIKNIVISTMPEQEVILSVVSELHSKHLDFLNGEEFLELVEWCVKEYIMLRWFYSEEEPCFEIIDQ